MDNRNETYNDLSAIGSVEQLERLRSDLKAQLAGRQERLAADVDELCRPVSRVATAVSAVAGGVGSVSRGVRSNWQLFLTGFKVARNLIRKRRKR